MVRVNVAVVLGLSTVTGLTSTVVPMANVFPGPLGWNVAKLTGPVNVGSRGRCDLGVRLR